MMTVEQRSLVRTPIAGAMLAGLLVAGPALGGPAIGGIDTPPGAVQAAGRASVDVDPVVVDVLAERGAAEVVVRTTPSSTASVTEAALDAGARLVAGLDFIDAVALEVDAEVLQALVARPDVVAVSHNAEASYHGESSSVPEGDDWFEQTINAHVARDLGFNGTGVGVAVVDSGVDAHLTLDSRLTAGFDSSGEADGVDRHGHGTFLAGLAAGTGASSEANAHDGVAPGAHVVPVKVGSEHGVRLVDLLEGLQWIHFHRDSHDIDVVNMSFGTSSAQSHTVDPLNFAVQRLWADGIVVVVSAGNTGEGGASTVTKPGDDPFVITVGSTDSNGTVDPSDDTVPAFSAQGPTLADGINKPDVVAPGRSVVGPVGTDSAIAAMTELHVGEGWVKASGTSMSAAVVSGAVALVLDAHPDWTPDQVKGALLDSAAPGPVGDSNVDGHGVVDVAAAIAVTEPSNPNQGIPFGTGTGSLSDTLGLGDTVTVDVLVEECALDTCVWVEAQIEADADDLVFYDAAAFLTDWTAESWDQTQWQGNQWQGNQWQGNQWQGNQWQGNQWQGNQWQGSEWQGNQWQGNQWQGNQWQGNQWQGNQWQ